MPYSKILFIACLFFIGSIFVLSFVFLEEPEPSPQPQAEDWALLASLKEKFQEAINSNLPSPQSAILAGILLGDKASFSHDWKQKMANTGTSHIVAVSGMNIVMLAQILVVLGVALGLYRGQALWFSLILIWLFIALIGFQVSAIRAGIMGSILIVCGLLGRQNASFRALVLAVAIMLAINPTLLRYNLSFQLSVLATLGLIHLGPVIKRKVCYEIISATLSAQIFTTPLLIYTFGYVSLIGLPLNLLIVPIVPAIMILGIVFLLGALVYNPLGVVLSWPLAILLSLIVWLIDTFSKIPFATVHF
ncbi:MAG: ComEC/Rec2 family competence protein [bacterium]